MLDLSSVYVCGLVHHQSRQNLRSHSHFEPQEDFVNRKVFPEGKRKKCFLCHCHLVYSEEVQSIMLVSKQGIGESFNPRKFGQGKEKPTAPQACLLSPALWQPSHFQSLLWICHFLFQIPELSHTRTFPVLFSITKKYWQGYPIQSKILCLSRVLSLRFKWHPQVQKCALDNQLFSLKISFNEQLVC